MPHEYLRTALDTSRDDEDIYMAADRWLTTLADWEQRTEAIIAHLTSMIARRR